MALQSKLQTFKYVRQNSFFFCLNELRQSKIRLRLHSYSALKILFLNILYTPYTGSLSIARNMAGQKKNLIQKMQPYHSASRKSEPRIAEQKQRTNLTQHTLKSAHLSEPHTLKRTHTVNSTPFRQHTPQSATFQTAYNLDRAQRKQPTLQSAYHTQCIPWTAYNSYRAHFSQRQLSVHFDRAHDKQRTRSAFLSLDSTHIRMCTTQTAHALDSAQPIK